MSHSKPPYLFHKWQSATGLPGTALLAALLVMSGCGGGGGGGGGSTSGSTPVAATTVSTSLSDNPLTGIVSLDNFATSNVQLTVGQIITQRLVTFSGDHTFLKLARSDGEVLFLGEVDSDQPLELLVDLPVDSSRIHYEIFTESALDDTLFGEIVL